MDSITYRLSLLHQFIRNRQIVRFVTIWEKADRAGLVYQKGENVTKLNLSMNGYFSSATNGGLANG